MTLFFSSELSEEFVFYFMHLMITLVVYVNTLIHLNVLSHSKTPHETDKFVLPDLATFFKFFFLFFVFFVNKNKILVILLYFVLFNV